MWVFPASIPCILILISSSVSQPQPPLPQFTRHNFQYRPTPIQVRYDSPFDSQYGYSPPPLQRQASLLGKAVAGFTVDSYREILRKTREQENKVYSPWGINILLGMLLAGTGGETAAEIQNALRLNGFANDTIFQEYGQTIGSLSDQSDVQLVSANKLYLEKCFTPKPQYVKIITEAFRGQTEVINFLDRLQTSQKVNRWISGTTNGKIQNLVSPDSISVDTLAMLVNGIYFKGKWIWPFNPQRTMDMPFYYDTERNYSTIVPMMEGFGNLLYGEIQQLDAQAVVLPYTGDRFAMVLLLPKKPIGFENLENNLVRGFDLTTVLNPDITTETFVLLRVPKFKIESDINFVEEGILQNLGIKSVLGNGSRGPDMSGLSDEPGLYVDSVYQKTVIEMSEDGTEGASGSVATAVRRVSPKIFNANKPFIGYVMDKMTKTILFFFRKVK